MQQEQLIRWAMSQRIHDHLFLFGMAITKQGYVEYALLLRCALNPGFVLREVTTVHNFN